MQIQLPMEMRGIKDLGKCNAGLNTGYSRTNDPNYSFT